MFLHTTEGFPEYLSHWILKVCPCRQEKHFPSICAIEFSKYAPASNRKISRVSEPLNFHNMVLQTTEGFPEYLRHWIFEVRSCTQQKDFQSIWATKFSKHALAYNRKISRVSEPLNFRSMFLHTTEGFLEDLSHWSFQVWSCIQQKHVPSTWAIEFAKYCLPVHGRISRIPAPLNFRSMLLHTTEGFPEYLSHWIFKVCACIQQKDFPTICAIEFAKYVPAYNKSMSRVSEPLNFLSMFLHTTEGFPEYLSHWIFQVCSCIQQKDFQSIWATKFSQCVPANNRRISRAPEPVNFQSTVHKICGPWLAWQLSNFGPQLIFRVHEISYSAEAMPTHTEAMPTHTHQSYMLDIGTN